MAYSLIQVQRKIQAICLAHKQIRSFFYGLEQDLLTAKTTKYPAVFLQDNGGNISTNGQATILNWKLYFLDLVNVATYTNENDTDVINDMVYVAMDVMAQLNRSENRWVLSTDNNIQILAEHDNDMPSGVVVDFSIRFPWAQDICAIPTTFNDYTTSGGAGTGAQVGIDSNVYDLVYIGLGTEGSSLVIAALKGKKILLITRESGQLYKTSSAPDTAEYTWDGTTITFGLPVPVNARFLILYRNY